MLNLKSLLCECGCQNNLDKPNIDLKLLDTLQNLDKQFGFKLDTIISGYRCPNRIQHLIDLAKKGIGNMPAKDSFHNKLPIMACDIVHEKLTKIFLLLYKNHVNDYGLGFYFNGWGKYSVHIDSRQLKMRWICVNGVYLYEHQSPKYEMYFEKIKLLG